MLVRITEQDLRGAMREPRYWNAAHPERQAFNAWVGQGFRGLNPADGEARSAVWVRDYMREGHMVSAHWRSAPPRHGTEQVAAFHPGPIHSPSYGIEPVSRGPVRPRPTQAPRPSVPREKPPPARREPLPRERIVDEQNRDRTAELRERSEWMAPFHPNGDQWARPGGTVGREADLMLLRPVGEPEIVTEGVLRYRLADGRIATLRSATSPGAGGVNTLEIAQPSQSRGPGRFDPTDKFRYPTILRNTR